TLSAKDVTPGIKCGAPSMPSIRPAPANNSSKESNTYMPSPKSILVTGSTGFVGSHLAYRLLEQGHRVTALARGGKNATARERVVEVLAQVASPAEQLDRHINRLDVL